jgi:hypothetical protein
VLECAATPFFKMLTSLVPSCKQIDLFREERRMRMSKLKREDRHIMWITQMSAPSLTEGRNGGLGLSILEDSPI